MGLGIDLKLRHLFLVSEFFAYRMFFTRYFFFESKSIAFAYYVKDTLKYFNASSSLVLLSKVYYHIHAISNILSSISFSRLAFILSGIYDSLHIVIYLSLRLTIFLIIFSATLPSISIASA